jgi:hypothetical protein
LRSKGFLLLVLFSISALVAFLFLLGWAALVSGNIMARSIAVIFSHGVIVYPNASDVILFKANVRFYNNGTSIDLDIGNNGTSDAQISRALIGTSASNMQNQITIPSLPFTLSAGSIARVTISNMNLWSLGTTYYFGIVTSPGQTLPAWPEQAPNSNYS